MSSTYAHYQGPSSLPSDYAIVSRINSQENEFPHDSDDEHSEEQNHRGVRRESFAQSRYYRRPMNPTIGSYTGQEQIPTTSHAHVFNATETTPLLNNPPIPRIEEAVDRDPAADDGSTLSMFWKEAGILSKYALPVFG